MGELQPEEVEALLIKPYQDPELIKRLLVEWEIDRVDLLRELMEKNQWESFYQILQAIAAITPSEDYNREYQKKLYQLFSDFLSERVRRRQKKIYVWTPFRRDDERMVEILFLKSLKRKYLLEGLKKSFSGDLGIGGLFSYPKWKYDLSPSQIKELIDHVREKDPTQADLIQEVYARSK